MRWKVSNLEITYKKAVLTSEPVRNSADLNRLFMHFWDKDVMDLREDFCLLTFDTKLNQIGFTKVFSGGMRGTTVDKRILFGIATAAASDAVAVAHNHPSGELEPSANDYHVTRSLYDGFDILGIRMVDHLIISRTGYFSFADEGYI